ncbi:pyridoxamine 5'-phosphate oxidase family protein [Paenibacillus xanthanilyticus]|uniref:Pyridoxamine 5'-phosphate oxidase family protein n=1 Tax=Paenibacillus xanthanilyticus TaxID=1783531 RepID=A0ABV8K3X0_9BACL
MANPYHDGELAVQRMAGAEIVAQQNGRSIRASIVPGAAAFLGTQTLLIAAVGDVGGRIWASCLTGPPGFIAVQGDKRLSVAWEPAQDPLLAASLAANPHIGLLAIDLGKRFRLRINGTGTLAPDGTLDVAAEQVYGNCPKYIQQRTAPSFPDADSLPARWTRTSRLSEGQRQWIARADTFFIGSRSADGKMDASHRGGSPGFVRVVDERTIVFPDYFGNSMFNTLGNIHSHPGTGLLFIDFDSGDALQLTGRSRIIWDEEQIAAFPGAERLVRFELAEALHAQRGPGIRRAFVSYSPVNPSL